MPAKRNIRRLEKRATACFKNLAPIDENPNPAPAFPLEEIRGAPHTTKKRPDPRDGIYLVRRSIEPLQLPLLELPRTPARLRQPTNTGIPLPRPKPVLRRRQHRQW